VVRAKDQVSDPAPASGSGDEYLRLKAEDLLYREVLDSVADGILIIRDTEIVDCNRRVEELFELGRNDIVGRHPWQLGTRNPETVRRHESRGRDFMRRARDGEHIHAETYFEAVDGGVKTFNMSLSRFELADGPRLLCRLTEITDLVQARRELEALTAFEVRLLEMTNQLLEVSTEELPDAVASTLHRIADRYGIERASVWWLHSSSQLGFGNQAVGFGEESSTFVVREFNEMPWVANHLIGGQSEIIAVPEALPADAHRDREYFEKAGIRSALMVPVGRNEDGVCVAGVSMLSRRREWSDEERIELPLLLKRVGAAWSRYVHQFQNQEGDRDLARLQRLAEVGSHQIVPANSEPLSWENARLIQSDQAIRTRGRQQSPSAREALLEHVHADDRDQVEQALRDIAALDRRSPLQYRVVDGDRRIAYVEERFEIDRNSDGTPIRIFGTLQDVTARVETAVSLMQALQEIRGLKDRLEAQNVALREEVRVARGFDQIIGRSETLRHALEAAESVAATDVTVLLLGETGTGKELVARSIHESSTRHDGPLVSVNCAALSADLIESELFGHERGAFTHAVAARKGRFELADGGTLFLDEIGELPLDLQSKLLRVLQTGEFDRLGGTRTIKVDARVIAATNKQLEQMVESGRFRADLYYRINHFPIELPSLRDRRDDIPALASHFVEKHAQRLGKSITAISDRFLTQLMSLDWPGNVRELESYVQRAIIGETGSTLDHCPPAVSVGVPVRSDGGAAPEAGDDQSLESMQRRHILAALDHCNWTVDGEHGAASLLGLPASSLRSKMKRLGIERS